MGSAARPETGNRVVGPWWLELEGAVRSSPVVVPGIFGHHAAQVPFADDQHPVGDLRPGGEHEPLRIGVRARTPGRDFNRFDAGISQDRIERRAELPCGVPKVCLACELRRWPGQLYGIMIICVFAPAL